MHPEPGRTRNIGRFASTWGRHLLRRPREVSPVTLEEGARIVEGDPATSSVLRIEGGRLRLNPGFVADVRENRVLIRQGSGLPVVATMSCECRISPPQTYGICYPVAGGSFVFCQSAGCGGLCEALLWPGQPSVRLSLRAPG